MRSLSSSTVHLLVGSSWEFDLLDHAGTITDRVFPGTDTPCPFLQHRSIVNVYFELPEQCSSDQSPTFDVLGGSVSSPLLVDNSPEEDVSSPENLLTLPAAASTAGEASSAPPLPSPLSSRRRHGMNNGERGRTHPGQRGGAFSGEHGDEDLDALISDHYS